MILGIMVLLIAENLKNKQSIEMKVETGKHQSSRIKKTMTEQ